MASNRTVYAISAVIVATATMYGICHRKQRAQQLSDEESYARALSLLGAAPMMAQADHVHDLRRAWFVAWHRKLFGDKGPKIIHVAGTNGKGTTCNLLRNALVGLGYNVGLFSSPHLHSPCERIQVGVQSVPWRTLAALTERHALDMQPWMVPFDRFLVVALAHFASIQCDYIVLETGIGGLYDSTNYVEQPVACVITSISFDHCGLLGHTIAEIARQKAGIIKPSCEVAVTSMKQNPLALSELQAAATVAGVTLQQAEPSMRPQFSLSPLDAENAGLAEATLEGLGMNIASLDLSAPYRWPGRFEEMKVNGQVRVLLDCAHNPDAIGKLLNQVRHRYPARRLAVLFGANTDKELSSMVVPVANAADVIIFATSSHPLAASSAVLEMHAQSGTASFSSSASVEDGLESLLAHSDPSGTPLVLVCGSSYVVAKARVCLIKQYPSAFPKRDVAYSAFELGFR